MAKKTKTPSHGAIMSFWTDVPPSKERDFNAWYDTEHLPERVAVPGFQCGIRYVSLRAKPKYMAFYEIDTPEVLSGRAYLGRLNDPTPWTQRTMRTVINGQRVVYRPAFDAGLGHGGVLFSHRFASDATIEKVRGVLQPRLEQLATKLQRVRLWRSDTALSDVESEERRLRGDAPSPQSWCVVAEATTLVAMEQALKRHPLEPPLRKIAAGPVKQGRYRLLSYLRAGEY